MSEQLSREMSVKEWEVFYGKEGHMSRAEAALIRTGLQEGSTGALGAHESILQKAT